MGIILLYLKSSLGNFLETVGPPETPSEKKWFLFDDNFYKKGVFQLLFMKAKIYTPISPYKQTDSICKTISLKFYKKVVPKDF